MTITGQLKDNVLFVALQGRLDTLTAPDFEAEINASLDQARKLVIDMEKLDYISSAGLRVLLTAHKNMAGKDGMKILHPNEIVCEVFEVTGFSGILTIED